MKLHQYYGMPDGSMTTSVDRYRNAYRRLAKACRKVFGGVTIGFDPGISLSSISLTSYQAIKVWELVNGKKWKDSDCK